MLSALFSALFHLPEARQAVQHMPLWSPLPHPASYCILPALLSYPSALSAAFPDCFSALPLHPSAFSLHCQALPVRHPACPPQSPESGYWPSRSSSHLNGSLQSFPQVPFPLRWQHRSASPDKALPFLPWTLSAHKYPFRCNRPLHTWSPSYPARFPEGTVCLPYPGARSGRSDSKALPWHCPYWCLPQIPGWSYCNFHWKHS